MKKNLQKNGWAHLLWVCCVCVSTVAFGKTALYTEYITSNDVSDAVYFGEVGRGESKGIVYNRVENPIVLNAYNFGSPSFSYSGKSYSQYALSKSITTTKTPLNMVLSATYRRICATNDHVRYLYAGNSSSITLGSANVSTEGLLASFVSANHLDSEKPTAATVFHQDWKVDWEFVLTYDLNGGEGRFAATTFTNAVTIAANVPTRTGYSFAGWRDVVNGADYPAGATLRLVEADSTKDKTLTRDDPRLEAKWTPIQYTIRFAPSGGDGTMSDLTMVYDAEKPLPSVGFKREGYVFDGWAFAETPVGGERRLDDREVVSNLADQANAVVWLYARWRPAQVTVELKPNGGTVTPTNVKTTYGEPYPELPTPTRASVIQDGWETSYEFVSWKTSSAYGGVAVKEGDVYDNMYIKELFAQWAETKTGLWYRVTFNASGGTVSPASKTYQNGSRYSDLPVPTRDGYTFDNWQCADRKIAKDDTVVLVSNVTFVASYTLNSYKVSYNRNCENASGSMSDRTVSYGTTFTLPDCGFTRTGYTFQGWARTAGDAVVEYKSGESVSNLAGKTKNNETVTLYAVWKANDYTIRFVANGGSGSMTDLAATYDRGVALTRCGFTWTGYTFQGWADSSGGSKKYADGATVTNLTATQGATVTLYAVWTANTYKIGFNANGGGGSMSDLSATYGKGVALTRCGFARTGYTFLGWNDAANGKVYADGATVTNLTASLGGKVTLDAMWRANTYTIRFEANGGSGGMGAIPATYDKAVVLTKLGFARTGYAFQGWADSPGGAKKFANRASVMNLSATQGATVTLYAVWKANSYTIRFDANGGSGSMADLAATYDRGIALTSCGFTRTGYTFQGWAESPDGEKKYANGVTVSNLSATQGATVTLYAVWTANTYTIRFNANGGSGSMAELKATYDTGIALPGCGFTWTGRTFQRWRDTANNRVYADGATVTNLTATQNGTVTLNAEWTANTYTICFNANGGSGSMDAMAATYGTSTNLASCAFAKTGYTFQGWAKSPTGAKEYVDCASVSNLSALQGATVTLYAVWKANTYRVRFNSNGGSGYMDDQTFTYDAEPVALTRCGFRKDGHEFVGWARSEDGEVAFEDADGVRNLSASQGATVTLYAVWKAGVYRIELDAQGGSVPSNAVYLTYGRPYGALPAPVRADTEAGGVITSYAFAGWRTDGGVSVTATKVFEDLTVRKLLANWTTSKTDGVYRVTFDAAGGTVKPGTADYQHAAKYPELPIPVRTGYGFVDWMCGGSRVRKGDTVALVSNVTFVASYTANVYRVTFDPNGGTGGQEFAIATYDAPLPSVTNAPAFAGMLFDGFFDGTNAESVCYYDAKLAAKVAAWTNPSNVTLYAQWSVNQVFDLALDPGEKGAVEPTSLVVTNGEPLVTLPTPTNSLSTVTFAGWWTGEGGTGEQRQTGDRASLAEKTLYARWKPCGETAEVTVKIGFGKQNGTSATCGGREGMDDFVCPVGTTVAELPVPKSDNGNYAFAWYECDGRALDADCALTGDVVRLETRWTLKKFNDWTGIPLTEVAFDSCWSTSTGQATASKGDWEVVTDETHRCPGSAVTLQSSGLISVGNSNLSMCFAHPGKLIAAYAAVGTARSELQWQDDLKNPKTAGGESSPTWLVETNEFAHALVELQHTFYKAGNAHVGLAAFSWQPSAPETGIDPWALAEVRTNVVFETGGTAAWALADETNPDVGIVSQPIDDGGYAWVRGTVQGRGVLTFDWRVSCEGGYTDAAGAFVPCDFVELTDETGARLAFLDGVTNAESVAVTVTNQTAGTHVYTWCYRKDATGAAGDDRAWLNGVIWRPLAGGDEPTELDAPTVSAVRLADGVFSLSFAADSRFDYVLEASPTLVPPEWRDVAGPKSVEADGPLVFTPPVAAGEPQMFYRVRVQAK